jgi:sporulation protein YlmC with PRC-barrel domain
MLRRARKLFGYTVRATDGNLGKIIDLYLDAQSWTIRYLAVETGPWLLGRRALVRPTKAEEPQDDERVVPILISREEVEKSPEIELAKTVPQEEMAQLDEYWGWPHRLAESRLVQRLPVDEAHVAREQDAIDRQKPRSHLWSAREIRGYRIRARDGEFGRVEDFYLTTDEWMIRYLMIDTQAWGEGRHVLIAPPWLEEFDWRERTLAVGLTQEQIEASPFFDPSEPITREYELALCEHYGRDGYWG